VTAPPPKPCRLLDYVQRTVCAAGMQLAVILDAQASPHWVLRVRSAARLLAA
jgi:hypothetical protein